MKNTLKYYNDNAESYFERTVGIPLDLAYPYLTKWIPPSSHILDIGAGSGRDSKFFLDHGYKVTSIDGSRSLAEIAQTKLGVHVKVMSFDELSEVSCFDGVWANSSLLHLTDHELQAVLSCIERALKPSGYFYASFKFGHGELTDSFGRYFRLHNFLTLPPIIEDSTGLELLTMERTGSYGESVATEWLHMVAHKPNSALNT